MGFPIFVEQERGIQVHFETPEHSYLLTLAESFAPEKGNVLLEWKAPKDSSIPYMVRIEQVRR